MSCTCTRTWTWTWIWTWICEHELQSKSAEVCLLTSSKVVLALVLSCLTVSGEAVRLIAHTGRKILQERVPGAVPSVPSAIFLYITLVTVRPAHRAVRSELTVWLAAGAFPALCTCHQLTWCGIAAWICTLLWTRNENLLKWFDHLYVINMDNI